MHILETILMGLDIFLVKWELEYKASEIFRWKYFFGMKNNKVTKEEDGG